MTTLSLDQIYERVTRFEDESPLAFLLLLFFSSFLDSTTGPWRVAIVRWSREGKGNDPYSRFTKLSVSCRLFPPLNEIIVDSKYEELVCDPL